MALALHAYLCLLSALAHKEHINSKHPFTKKCLQR